MSSERGYPGSADASRPARARRGGPSRRVTVGVRALGASLSLLILLAAGISWATFANFQDSVPQGLSVPADSSDPDGSDQDILLVGNDTRAGATRAELMALHAGHDMSSANADTMMVLHVPSDGSRPTIVSFPRDSWVSIPGHGKGKINSAYPRAYDAAKSAHKSEKDAQSAGLIAAISTIHALTGLQIDHYMQVSLLGFYRISEAIGGVSVCLKAPQNKTTEVGDGAHGNSGIDLPKGVSVIEGTQALAFVRQRHGLPHGDLDRIKRQQYFLKSAFGKITSAGTLLNPFKMRDLLKAVGRSLLVDPKLDLVSLARQFESLTSGKIKFATIPNNGPQLIHPDGVATSIVEVDRAAMPAFVAHLEGKGDNAFATAKAADPARVTVDVLNGAGIARLASRNATALKRFGFKIDAVDSAATTPHTSVEYPAGKEAQAKAVLRVVLHANAVESPDVARVTLVLGIDGRTVSGVASTRASASAAPRPAAASRSDPTNGLGCID